MVSAAQPEIIAPDSLDACCMVFRVPRWKRRNKTEKCPPTRSVVIVWHEFEGGGFYESLILGAKQKIARYMRNGISIQLKSRTNALFPGDNFESHTINATKANKSMTADIEICLKTKSMVVFFIFKVKHCNRLPHHMYILIHQSFWCWKQAHYSL